MIKKGAGFIIVKRFGTSWKVLGLRTGSYYDLPKGTSEDEDASTFHTAVRECEEECSIRVLESDVMFNFDNIVLGPLTIFIANTSQVPKIKKNEKSGIFEHEGFEWLDFKNLKQKVIPYLRPAVDWASNKMGF